MRTLKEIKLTLTNSKKYLFEKYPIRSIAIFGSYARKEQNDKSDLDLMVEFNKKIGIRFIDLAYEIEDIIGFKVDLVSKKAINDKYYKTILPELIYV